jgi:hypothetical protein
VSVLNERKKKEEKNFYGGSYLRVVENRGGLVKRSQPERILYNI